MYNTFCLSKKYKNVISKVNDSGLTVAMLFLACGPKMTVNEFHDKKIYCGSWRWIRCGGNRRWKLKFVEIKNADETTDITFIIKSTLQCYRATMARLNMFTKNPSEPPEQMAIVFRDTAEIDRMIDLLQNVKKMAIWTNWWVWTEEGKSRWLNGAK